MTHNYYFRLGLLMFFLALATTLSAQWARMTSPGKDYIIKVFKIGNAWIAHGSSGCYRSIDDGLHWEKTLAASSSLSSVEVAGTDIYSVVYDKGLYRSSDQGLNWTLLSNQPQSGSYGLPDGLVVTNSNIFYESKKAVFRYDKANPAALTTVLSIGQLPVLDNLKLQAQSNDLWVTVKDSLLRSTDQGNSWNLVHEGFRAQGFAILGDTLMICTEAGIQRSVDKGVNWVLLPVVGNPYDIYVSSNQWFVFSYSGPSASLLTSSNGGNSWKQFSARLDQDGLVFVAKSGNTILAGTDRGIARNTNGASYWEYQNTGIYYYSTDPINTNYITKTGDYLSKFGDFSEDEGQTWFQPIIDGGRLQFPGVEYNGNYYVLDYDQKLYRSTDDVRHWHYMGTQFNPGYKNKLFVLDNHLYNLASSAWNGINATVYESMDNGVNWVQTDGVVSNAFQVIGHKDYLFEFHPGNGLLRSADGGLSWQPVGAGLEAMAQSDEYIGVYSDGAHVFVYGVPAIMFSDDDGLTFTKISDNIHWPSNTDAGVNGIISDGHNLVAVSSYGLFLSQGFNDQWTNITDNMPKFYQNGGGIIINGNIIIDWDTQGTPFWKRSLASFGAAQFSGKVWRDENNNGQQDPGELPYPGALVRTDTKSMATSAADGQYSVFGYLSSDTIRVIKPAPWVQANPAFYKVSSTVGGKDFGLYFPPNITDLRVDLTNQTGFKPGFSENIYLSYFNAGTADADAVVRFVPKAGLVFESASLVPDGNIGDTIIWMLSNLPAFSDGKIVVNVTLPANAPINSYAQAFASITPGQPDANNIDNQFSLKEKILGSFSLNDKRCNLPYVLPAQMSNISPMEYTIRFQNTGNNTVGVVRIVDTFDFYMLDVSTFKVLSSSHPCTATLRSNGIAEFYFDQISLPPSATNEPGSIGFVKFSIIPRPNLASYKKIYNTAHIYFDADQPFVTNTTVTLVVFQIGTNDLEDDKKVSLLRIFPNPTTGKVQIQTGENLTGYLRVFNSAGLVLRVENNFSDNDNLDLSALRPGLYTIEWRSEKGHTKAGRLIRMQ